MARPAGVCELRLNRDLFWLAGLKCAVIYGLPRIIWLAASRPATRGGVMDEGSELRKVALQASYSFGFRLWVAWRMLVAPDTTCATIVLLMQDLSARRDQPAPCNERGDK